MVKAFGSSTSPAAPDFERGGLAAHGGGMLARTDEGDQAPLAAAVDFEQLFVGNIFDLFPDVGIVETLAPVGLAGTDRRAGPGRR